MFKSSKIILFIFTIWVFVVIFLTFPKISNLSVKSQLTTQPISVTSFPFLTNSTENDIFQVNFSIEKNFFTQTNLSINTIGCLKSITVNNNVVDLNNQISSFDPLKGACDNNINYNIELVKYLENGKNSIEIVATNPNKPFGISLSSSGQEYVQIFYFALFIYLLYLCFLNLLVKPGYLPRKYLFFLLFILFLQLLGTYKIGFFVFNNNFSNNLGFLNYLQIVNIQQLVIWINSLIYFIAGIFIFLNLNLFSKSQSKISFFIPLVLLIPGFFAAPFTLSFQSILFLIITISTYFASKYWIFNKKYNLITKVLNLVILNLIIFLPLFFIPFLNFPLFNLPIIITALLFVFVKKPSKKLYIILLPIFINLFFAIIIAIFTQNMLFVLFPIIFILSCLNSLKLKKI